MTSELSFDPEAARGAIEYCYAQGWTDGLPVVPATEEALNQFIERSGRDPQEVLVALDQLGRSCTVEQAAINAIMAGCLPEYFPVVLATLEALKGEGTCFRGGLQSTTGAHPLIVVNGPIRDQLGMNSRGNVFGPGFRPNATIGRAIRLIILNVLGVRPHDLDQTTQGSPAKYTFCIAENEEENPWEPLHVEKGCSPGSSAVTVYMARSHINVDNRYTENPEHVMLTIADAMSTIGTASHRAGSRWAVVMGPEHAQLLAKTGWSKAGVKQFLWEHHGRVLADMRRMGKGDTQERVAGRFDYVAESTGNRWPGWENQPDDAFIHFSASPEQILIVVAGANNNAISTVVPSFGAHPALTSYTQQIR
jgi:hypothetical protein